MTLEVARHLRWRPFAMAQRGQGAIGEVEALLPRFGADPLALPVAVPVCQARSRDQVRQADTRS